YFFVVNNKTSLKYLVKKTVKFFVDYYTVYLIVLVSAILFCGYELTFTDFINDIYPVYAVLMKFAWYVPFYVEALFLLYMLKCDVSKYGNKKSFYGLLIAYMILELIVHYFKSIGYKGTFLVGCLNDLKLALPFMVMGFYFAYYDVFQRSMRFLNNRYGISKVKAVVVLMVVTVISVFNYKILGVQSGIIYTPIYIACIAYLDLGRYAWLEKISAFISKHSANIWFVHCAFFNEVMREVFQPIAFWPGNPILVLIWIIIICSMFSMLIMPVQNFIKEKAMAWL
ncbi:MAG: hypothetical protein SO119_03425, partial [Phascolarctobacterium sp.]|nr:hypothetical protein [Phascolarctobacterium sp.]